MPEMTLNELLLVAGLQVAGFMLGAVLARVTGYKRASNSIFNTLRLWANGLICTGLAFLTLIGFAGAEGPILVLFTMFNHILPVVGNILFFLPAFAFSFAFFARRTFHRTA